MDAITRTTTTTKSKGLMTIPKIIMITTVIPNPTMPIQLRINHSKRNPGLSCEKKMLYFHQYCCTYRKDLRQLSNGFDGKYGANTFSLPIRSRAFTRIEMTQDDHTLTNIPILH